MLCLVWFLVAAEVLGTSFELPVWEAHLKAIDSSLPTTVVEDFKVCYYFDLAQTCAKDAISTFLHQAPVSDVLTWTPTLEDCSKLLKKQRIPAERAAISLFGTAIASAATAGVTIFELLAQSWVIRVSHHALSVKQKAFVAAINSISDWATVHCDGANLLYDGKSIPKPDFMGAVDCDILGIFYGNVCGSGSCTMAEGTTCCESYKSRACCQTHLSTVQSECSSNASCTYKSTCCSLDSASLCCTGIPPDPCINGSCTLAEGTICCVSNKSNTCCQAYLPAIQQECFVNVNCEYKSACCSVSPTSSCCTGVDVCRTSTCTSEEGSVCCDVMMAGSCCEVHALSIIYTCGDPICSSQGACCNLVGTESACCQGPPCHESTCSAASAALCCETDSSGLCCDTHRQDILNVCLSDARCSTKAACCSLDSASSCCVGPCAKGDSCTTEESFACCPVDTDSVCCKKNLGAIQPLCSDHHDCAYQSGCCEMYPSSACCLQVDCSLSNCGDAKACCLANDSSSCCTEKESILRAECYDNPSCSTQQLCCKWNPYYQCCRQTPDTCDDSPCVKNAGTYCCTESPQSVCCQGWMKECSSSGCDAQDFCCTLTGGISCCGSNKSSTCCQAYLPTIQRECMTKVNCANKSTCCNVSPTSSCCTGGDACSSDGCTFEEAELCCDIMMNSLCCDMNLVAVLNQCGDPTCSSKGACCNYSPQSACCQQP